MNRRVAVAATLTAGLLEACLALPQYEGPVLIDYTETADGATIASADFSLHFAGGSGFHFPDALTMDDANLLGHESASACYDASGAGFSLYPTPRVSADGSAPTTQNELVPVLRGHAVIQLRLDWATRFACNPRRAPSGHSTFTVFPDGRILRHDTLGDTSTEAIQASECACLMSSGTLNEFIISSYWTFARSFQTLYGLANDNAVVMDAPGPSDSPEQVGEICLDSGGHQLASVQIIPPPDPGSASSTVEIFGGTDVIGHRVEQPLGHPVLDALSWDIHSALFVGRDGCPTTLQRAIDYAQNRSQLAVNGTTYSQSMLDGMFGGDPGDGSHGIDVPDGNTTLSLPALTADGAPAPFTGSFAVWLRFPRAIDVPVATRAGAVGVWYLPQRVDDLNWIVWFRDPLLQTSDTIAIGPN